MADLGHQETEKILKDLEHRIAEEYKIAVSDMQKKLKAYQEQTEAQRLAQKELFSQGKITQKEYTDWCYRHMMMGKRWEQMLDVLTKDMHHANEIALGIVKKQMPDVYALNANYATYEIERQGKIDTGFVLYNHDTAEYLLGDERQLMPGPSDKKAEKIATNKDMQWNKQKIQSAVLQGVLQGESPYEVAKRLQQVGQMNYISAVRYARTMTTSAQNAGRYEAFHRADRLGVDLTIEWSATLDMRTRHEHRLMDGQRREVDEPFIVTEGGTTYEIMYPADCTGTSNAPQSQIWNCRCTLLSWVKGFEGETVKESPKMAGMSYEEWKEAKPEYGVTKGEKNYSSDKEQFERYQKVLKEEAPKDFTAFQNLKYNNPKQWAEMKSTYRLVNRYEVIGDVPIKDIVEMDLAGYRIKQSGFDAELVSGSTKKRVKSATKTGNSAILNVDGSLFYSNSKLGLDNDMMRNAYVGDLPLVGLSRMPRYEVLPHPTTNRRMDTEAKFLEYMSTRLDYDSSATITILSEKHICDSCMHVREQFMAEFPNVTVNIVSGKRGYNKDTEGGFTWDLREIENIDENLERVRKKRRSV